MFKKIRITGFGGQGVITAGFILGNAASVHDEKQAVFTQSYGPEARGSACSAQVVISDKPILLPFFKEHDILVALSQEGFDKYIGQTVKGGTVLVDEHLVEVHGLPENVKFAAIPSTQIAEKTLNNRIVTNIVMLGFFTAFTQVVSKEAMKASVLSVVPKRTEKLNEDALNFGFDFKPEKEVKKTKAKVETEA